MEIKRGYKKWFDEDGVFHKVPVEDEDEEIIEWESQSVEEM